MNLKSKKSLIKQLEVTAEKLWKARCLERDESKCQYPHVCADPVLQIDHCFSRTVKELKYDTRNGTTVCRTVNGMKKFLGKGGVYSKKIDDLVRKREGEPAWLEMTGIAERSPKGYKYTVGYLEDQIACLKKLKGTLTIIGKNYSGDLQIEKIDLDELPF